MSGQTPRILLIEGDLVLGGGFTWYGPILVTGSVTLNGGGGGINVHGQILSGTSTLTDVTINGGNVINYNSCEIKKAFATQPLTVVNWKQNLYRRETFPRTTRSWFNSLTRRRRF